MNTSKRRLLTVICLSAASLFLFIVQSSVILNDFVWDDDLLLGHQAKSNSPSKANYEVVTTDFLGNFDYTGLAPGHFWRPLTSIFLEISIRFFGSWTTGYRLISLFFWLFATFTFFLFANKVAPEVNTTVILFATLIWASHPVGADVTAMAVSISDFLSVGFLLLCAFFSFTVLIYDLRLSNLIVVFVCSFFAVSSKETGALSVFIPVMVSFLARNRAATRDLVRRVSISTLFSTVPVVLFLCFRSKVLENSGGIPALNDIMGWLALFPSLFGAFLLKIFIPLYMSSVYYLDNKWGTDFFVGITGLGFIALASAQYFRGKVNSPLPVFGLFWTLLTLALSALAVNPKDVTIGIPPRYFYVPLAGLSIASIPIFLKLQRQLREHVFVFLLFLTVLVLTSLSFFRLSDWRNNIIYHLAETAVNPKEFQPRAHLAWSFVKSGYFDKANQEIEFLRSLKSLGRANEAQILSLEAKILAEKEGDYPKAIERLKKALRLTPHDLSLLLGIAELKKLNGNRDESADLLLKALDWPQFSDKSSQRSLRQKIEALNGKNHE